MTGIWTGRQRGPPDLLEVWSKQKSKRKKRGRQDWCSLSALGRNIPASRCLGKSLVLDLDTSAAFAFLVPISWGNLPWLRAPQFPQDARLNQDRFLGIWVRELGPDLCLKTIFPKRFWLLLQNYSAASSGSGREKNNETPANHWIIIFKSWDLENKQNVTKNFYSAFCLLIFLHLCVRLFFHLKLTLTECSSDEGWDNPFWGELRALIACLDTFPSFFPLHLTFFVVQRPAVELQNISGESDRKNCI